MVKALEERGFVNDGAVRKMTALAIVAMVIMAAFVIPMQTAFAEVFEKVDLKIDKVVYEGEGYGPSGENGEYMPGDKVAFDVTATVEGNEEDFALETTIQEKWPEGITYTGCQVLNIVSVEGEWETHTPEVDTSDFPTIRICQKDYDICSMYAGQVVTIRFEGIVDDFAEEGETVYPVTAVNKVTFTADYQDPVSDEAEITIGSEEPVEPTEPSDSEDPTEPEQPVEPTDPTEPADETKMTSADSNVPKTGDGSGGGIMAAVLAGLAAAGGTGTVLFRKIVKGV